MSVDQREARALAAPLPYQSYGAVIESPEEREARIAVSESPWPACLHDLLSALEGTPTHSSALVSKLF